jgi:hypothetical protein
MAVHFSLVGQSLPHRKPVLKVSARFGIQALERILVLFGMVLEKQFVQKPVDSLSGGAQRDLRLEHDKQ